MYMSVSVSLGIAHVYQLLASTNPPPPTGSLTPLSSVLIKKLQKHEISSPQIVLSQTPLPMKNLTKSPQTKRKKKKKTKLIKFPKGLLSD